MPRNVDIENSVLRSFAEELRANFTDFTGIWIATKDFDYDKKSDGSSRDVPFIAILNEFQDIRPYEVSDKRALFELTLNLYVACVDGFQYQRLPFQVKQFLYTYASYDGTPGRFPLKNFSIDPAPVVGFFEIMLQGRTYPYPEISKKEWKNLRNAAVIEVTAEVIKDKTTSVI